MVKLEDSIRELCNSLNRAGDVFFDAYVAAREEGGYEVFFYLSESLTRRMESTARRYVKNYCKQDGWKAENFTVKKTYFRFTVRPEDPEKRREPRRTHQ
jgi:hypothetical protein